MKMFAASTLGLVAIVIGLGYWLYRQSASEDSVQIWVKGRGAGQTIRLYPHGNFDSSNWCDICPPDRQHGTWSNTPSSIILHPATGESVTYNRIEFRGCTALSQANADPPKMPTDVFFPADDHCGDAL